MQFAQLVVEIKAGPSIFARRTSVRASTTLARVVPKSVCAPQCFDFKSYFFVWWESWAKLIECSRTESEGWTELTVLNIVVLRVVCSALQQAA